MQICLSPGSLQSTGQLGTWQTAGGYHYMQPALTCVLQIAGILEVAATMS